MHQFENSSETSRTEIQESVGNETVESFFENRKNEQKLHFTTLPTENQAK